MPLLCILVLLAPIGAVPATADKIVVGRQEHVRLDPPGAVLIARIDTGATASSVDARNIERFDKNGQAWVRFELPGGAPVERPVVKLVRVVSQFAPEGVSRPVVHLGVTLGATTATAEFTLADRAGLTHAVLLGRDFLAGRALVDVEVEFVHPLSERGESRPR